jgi:hypothetical protein
MFASCRVYCANGRAIKGGRCELFSFNGRSPWQRVRASVPVLPPESNSPPDSESASVIFQETQIVDCRYVVLFAFTSIASDSVTSTSRELRQTKMLPPPFLFTCWQSAPIKRKMVFELRRRRFDASSSDTCRVCELQSLHHRVCRAFAGLPEPRMVLSVSMVISVRRFIGSNSVPSSL